MDDHLKNFSFIYDKENNNWNLAPAYDLTYALNLLITFKTTSRALSINAKRTEISRKDLLSVAEEYAIKNPKGIIAEVTALIPKWLEIASKLGIPEKIINTINKDFIVL